MPPTKPGAKRVERIEYGQDISDIEIGGSGTSVGTGGAVTKVSAAKIANDAGAAVLLTSADLVNEALSGVNVGTWFAAKG
jgi:glutamate 5-kinase